MNKGIENLSSRKLISECRDLAVACYNKSFDLNSGLSGCKTNDVKRELQIDLRNLMNKLKQLDSQ